MTRTLLSPHGGRSELVKFLSVNDDPVSIYVREDKSFKADARLEIARLRMHPSTLGSREQGLEVAVANGFYDIQLDRFDELADRVCDTLLYDEHVLAKPERVKRQKQRARDSLRFLPSIFARVGLVHPHFDADAVARMPLSTPATIVADTSAILNGGLDFVARFLYPIARIKVPGMVHMEIINEVDKYFYLRRQDNIKSGDALMSHIKGVGGQRVLLRLELQDDLEIERSSIFQEPMRNAFQPDPDGDGSLATTAVVRSYADRLILEAARQHQGQVSPGHPIYLMTSDQGLARMALAEGFQPLFFEVTRPESVFPSVLSGVNFLPFQGGLFGVPLSALLWELAVCFGSAGLQSDDGRFIDVAAIGGDLPWQPFHSKEDLLWFTTGQGVAGRLRAPEPDPAVAAAEAQQGNQTQNQGRRENRKQATRAPATTAQPSQDGFDTAVLDAPRTVAHRQDAPSYKFSAGELLRLLTVLIDRETLDRSRMAQLVGVKEEQIKTYLGFLKAGDFITLDGQQVTRTEHLVDLVQAMRSRDFRQVGREFRRVASFDAFISDLESRQKIPDDELKQTVFWRFPNYRRYGEASGRSLLIPGEGLYATPNDPIPEDFAGIAIAAYTKLSRAPNDYVLTGAWLEELVRSHSVHPLVARERLEQAQALRLLDRFTRGATPDTRFENHEFHVIGPASGGVQLTPVAIYHGDFLIPERTSVELRIERLGHEPQ